MFKSTFLQPYYQQSEVSNVSNPKISRITRYSSKEDQNMFDQSITNQNSLLVEILDLLSPHQPTQVLIDDMNNDDKGDDQHPPPLDLFKLMQDIKIPKTWNKSNEEESESSTDDQMNFLLLFHVIKEHPSFHSHPYAHLISKLDKLVHKSHLLSISKLAHEILVELFGEDQLIKNSNYLINSQEFFKFSSKKKKKQDLKKKKIEEEEEIDEESNDQKGRKIELFLELISRSEGGDDHSNFYKNRNRRGNSNDDKQPVYKKYKSKKIHSTFPTLKKLLDIGYDKQYQKQNEEFLIDLGFHFSFHL